MELSTAVRERVRNLLQTNNMTLWGLFKASGVPRSTLCYFMNENRRLINLSTLLHICEAFNISLKDFFDDPLFDDVEND